MLSAKANFWPPNECCFLVLSPVTGIISLPLAHSMAPAPPPLSLLAPALSPSLTQMTRQAPLSKDLMSCPQTLLTAEPPAVNSPPRTLHISLEAAFVLEAPWVNNPPGTVVSPRGTETSHSSQLLPTHEDGGGGESGNPPRTARLSERRASSTHEELAWKGLPAQAPAVLPAAAACRGPHRHQPTKRSNS